MNGGIKKRIGSGAKKGGVMNRWDAWLAEHLWWRKRQLTFLKGSRLKGRLKCPAASDVD